MGARAGFKPALCSWQEYRRDTGATKNLCEDPSVGATTAVAHPMAAKRELDRHQHRLRMR